MLIALTFLLCGLMESSEAGAAEAARDIAAAATSTDESEAAKATAANNPLANLIAFNVQNYYTPSLSESDETANQLWLRYAQPIGTPVGDFLVRASLPVSSLPTGPGTSQSGLGDGNVFATYLIDVGNPAVSVGVGPLAGFPTATDDALGNDQWSLGAAAVYFDARSHVVQWGGLVTYQHKVGGSSRLPAQSLLAVQPFGFVQIGKGYYFRSAPIWAFDIESGNYSVPVGLGLGKVVKIGSTVLNFFVEPQYTVLHDGPLQPKLQIFASMNMQFYGH
jgi:hypothetical protein